MTTKNIGKLLFFISVILVFASLVDNYFGLGDKKTGIDQLLEKEALFFVFLCGVFFFFFFPNRKPQFLSGIYSILHRLLFLSVSNWVIVGFFVVYFCFFILPVFLNSEHIMWYPIDFLPRGDPIGMDNRSVLLYIQNWLSLEQSPYYDGFILYPPLGLILLAPLLMFDYPTHYYVITFLTLFSYIVLAVSYKFFTRKKINASLFTMMFVLGLFSYGFQFELERGQFNVIAYSLCLVAVFMYHFSDAYRYPAYVLFSFGVQLKIYPLILIVMFIKNWRDWKNNIRRIVGILFLNYALLFVAGFDVYADFIHSVRNRQEIIHSTIWNHSLKSFVQELVHKGFGLFDMSVVRMFRPYQGFIELSLLLILGLCFALMVIHAYVRNVKGLNPYLLLVSTICALVIPSTSNDYKLPILTFPMILLWSSVYLPEHVLKRIFSILLVLVTSIAYWFLQYPYITKPNYLERSFPALFVVIVAVTTLNFVSAWDGEETI